MGKKYLLEQMPFRKYGEMLIADDPNAANYYLAVQSVRKVFPDIADEFPVPKYIGSVRIIDRFIGIFICVELNVASMRLGARWTFLMDRL